MHIVIITGPPGSGKGTQAKLLAEEFGYIHLSTGEMLRKEIALGSDLGKLAQARIDNGNFVPDHVACEMIRTFFRNNPELKGIIFDGFPRTLNQCLEFEPILNEYNTKVHFFIDIDVDKENLTTRLLARNSQQRRPDDSDLSIIEHRFELYNNLTKPVIDYYKNKKNYYKINGNSDIKNVFSDIKGLLSNYIKK
ncbi:MAG: adenylate kinase [Bacteroidales bacterium]|jgi:adenylate kinase|nr:adenylate kinase [Bacteroidales bacterium]